MSGIIARFSAYTQNSALEHLLSELNQIASDAERAAEGQAAAAEGTRDSKRRMGYEEAAKFQAALADLAKQVAADAEEKYTRTDRLQATAVGGQCQTEERFMSDLIDAIPDIRKNLAEEIDFKKFSNARASMRQLSDALERLSKKIDATADAGERNALVNVHTAAQRQWLDANVKLREAGEEWL